MQQMALLTMNPQQATMGQTNYAPPHTHKSRCPLLLVAVMEVADAADVDVLVGVLALPPYLLPVGTI
jgi:hypothetical protein